MEAINRLKLSDIVSQTLFKYILEYKLQKGDKLPSSNELSKSLNIGRTSIREGIRELEAIGLLTTRQGYGVSLNEVTVDMLFSVNRKIPLAELLILSKKELIDLMSLRLVIEIDICRLAAENTRAADLEKLEMLLEEMEQTKDDPTGFIVPDMAFHKQIAVSSGNVIYPKIFDMISELFRKQQTIVALRPGAKNRAIKYHQDILSFLKKKDADGTVEVIKAHLENTRFEIEKNFDEKHL